MISRYLIQSQARCCSRNVARFTCQGPVNLHATSFVPIFGLATTRSFSETVATRAVATVPITYVEADGTEKLAQAEIGKNLLETAHDNNIELEGACGGELACSTCHLIFEKEVYDTLPEKQDDEDDMLDLAFEVTETSRLGCQILVREDFAGIKVRIPDDGF